MQRTERRVRGRSESLARQFDRVLRVLEAWGYVDGWQLTDAGEQLARLYSETDLLLVEPQACRALCEEAPYPTYNPQLETHLTKGIQEPYVVYCIERSPDVQLCERGYRAFPPRCPNNLCDHPYCQFRRPLLPVPHLGLREEPLFLCCFCDTPAHDSLDRLAQRAEQGDRSPGSGLWQLLYCLARLP